MYRQLYYTKPISWIKPPKRGIADLKMWVSSTANALSRLSISISPLVAASKLSTTRCLSSAGIHYIHKNKFNISCNIDMCLCVKQWWKGSSIQTHMNGWSMMALKLPLASQTMPRFIFNSSFMLLNNKLMSKIKWDFWKNNENGIFKKTHNETKQTNIG